MTLLQEWEGKALKSVPWATRVYDGLLSLTPANAPDLFGDLSTSPRRFVAIDENVCDEYGPPILAQLDRFGVEHNPPFLIPAGEKAKTRQTASAIAAAMNEFGVPRFGEPPIAIGGGVTHDIFGIVAGEHRRGVDWYFIATTLLAAVDAMFALKCAVNEGWKNRAGLYHPARLSATDLAFFQTLLPADVLEGFAEIIKVAVAGDLVLFRLLEQHAARLAGKKFDPADPVAREIVLRAVTWMMRELKRNPFELVTRRASYLGHNISPGMEPRVPHGQAVVLDIIWTILIAWRRNMIGPRTRDRIIRLIASTGLHTWHPVMEDTDALIAALADTAAHRRNKQHVPTPTRIGRVTYLDNITTTELLRAVDDQHRYALAA